MDAKHVITPDRDSQFKLLPCSECYLSTAQYEAEPLTFAPHVIIWRVRCPICGHTIQGEQGQTLHDLQNSWNRRYRNGQRSGYICEK